MKVAVADEKQSGAGSDASAADAAAALDDRPVGQLLVEARTRRGLSAADITAQTRIPALYLKAIETDNYGLISDQLYLLPFLRRYASFVGMDPEDTASRFIHDVQRAETNVVRMSEPITMVARKRRPLRRIAIGVVLAAGVAILILLALAKLGMLRQFAIPGLGAATAVSPIAGAQSPPAAHPPGEPFATSIKPAAPQPGAGTSNPRQAGVDQPAPSGAPD
jgi:cytoskeletal protein RodZ